VKTVMRRWRTP